MIKEEALRRVQHQWNNNVRTCIESTSSSDLSYSDIIDNWMPPLQLMGRSIAFVGDSNHAMTPNLGQGGCCALEDSIELINYLMQSDDDISKAVSNYQKARAMRCTPISIKSYVIGAALQLENPLICYIRDKFIIPKIFSPQNFLSHTIWKCPDVAGFVK